MQVEAAPMRSPWREQTDCGMISPKMTMMTVEMMPPMKPLVSVADVIAMSALTSVLPRSSVHSSRLPCRRIGRMRRAQLPRS